MTWMQKKRKNTKLDHPIFPNCLHFGCRKNRKENSIDCKTNDLGSAGYGISFHPCRFGHFVFNLKEKVHDQRWDINLMKILGASFKDLNNIVRLEFGLLGLLASVLGVGLSSLVSFILAEFIFDKVWSFQILLPLGIVSIVVLLCIITAEWATKRTLKEKPSSILQEI